MPSHGGGSVHNYPAPPLSATRLFVVCSKSIDDALLARLFRAYPGMEYCDLKRDRATGRSKGYAYVNYSAPGPAAAASRELNGIEFPPGSGCRLKVMPAEILGAAPGPGAAGSAGGSGGSTGEGMGSGTPSPGPGAPGVPQLGPTLVPGGGHSGLGVPHAQGCSTPMGGGTGGGGGGLGGLGCLGGSAGSLRGSAASFCSGAGGRPPPSPALCSTGRAPGPSLSTAPSPAGTPLNHSLPSDLAAVQDGLGNMSIGRSGSSLGPIGGVAGGGPPSAVSSTGDPVFGKETMPLQVLHCSCLAMQLLAMCAASPPCIFKRPLEPPTPQANLSLPFLYTPPPLAHSGS
jgi:hypothetical protein